MSREVRRRWAEQRRKDRRTIAAIAVVFSGALLAVAATAVLESGPLAHSLIGHALMAAAGAAGVAILGFVWADSFAGLPSPAGWLLAVPAAGAMLSVSFAYVLFMGAEIGRWSAPTAGLVIAVVLVDRFTSMGEAERLVTSLKKDGVSSYVKKKSRILNK